MGSENGEQTELTKWMDDADEGDQTLAFVQADSVESSSESEKDRTRWIVDLVEKPQEWSTSRRAFLKLLSKSAVIGGGIAFKDVAFPEALTHFWPNALTFQESERTLGIGTLETLFDAKMGWEQFKHDSNAMLYDSEVVTPYDDVHMLSVFYRAIDKELISIIQRCSERADNVFIYFADPVDHQSKETAALGLHEEIELRCFRRLFRNKDWHRYYTDVLEHPSNNMVPHPNDSKLNRVRGLANALRAIQMGAFLTETHPNIHIRLIRDHELSIRGRLIGDHHATFVLNPKGTIGTTAPRLGFITDQEVVVEELHEERERITSKRTFSADDLLDLSTSAGQRAKSLVTSSVEQGYLSNEHATVLTEELESLVLEEVPPQFDINTWVEEVDEPNRGSINKITKVTNRCEPFEQVELQRSETILPGQMYQSIEQEVLKEFP